MNICFDVDLWVFLQQKTHKIDNNYSLRDTVQSESIFITKN